jgi:asparagine synthase (glutamine-hydrolysing)
MTLFFGLMNAKKNPLSNNLIIETKKVFVGHVGVDGLVEKKQDYFYCLGFDSGAFKCPAVIDDKSNSSFSLLTGEPLISGKSRYVDLSIMHDEFISGNFKSHKLARGVYSGLFFNPEHGDLFFITDKLGIRPVYLYSKNDLLVFSSTLNLMTQLSFLDLTIDKLGLCENIAFGYPLDDRTPYKFIKRLKSAEEILISDTDIKSNIYWDWSSFIDNSKSTHLPDLTKKTYNAFEEAVAIRVQDETNAIAFLSGGMDSRCVTASVKQHVNNLYTFNFSITGSQDAFFAAQYSKHLQSKHFEYFKEFQSYPNWSQLINDAWCGVNDSITSQPNYPQKVWSGDGGSVGLGYVYMNDNMLEFLNKGLVNNAVNEFLSFNRIGLPIRYLDKEFLQDIDINSSVAKYLSELADKFSSHSLYFFLMFNDQRRHLFDHFETIATHKIELLMPYLDSIFISKIAEVPVFEMSYHKFYAKWFEHFPSFVRQSPWQTYPGHVKCPLENSDDSLYQWNLRYPKYLKNQEISSCIKIILCNAEINKFLNIPMTLLALMAHRFGMFDSNQLTGTIRNINKYVNKL